MTNEEYKKYKKRLYVLMEKGIKVKIESRKTNYCILQDFLD